MAQDLLSTSAVIGVALLFLAILAHYLDSPYSNRSYGLWIQNRWLLHQLGL